MKDMHQDQQKIQNTTQPQLSVIPLGGIEDVTKNMYVYEYKNEILIVDCGIGFADASALGVDLLLPDITYLIQNCLPADKAKKRIVGLLLSHGHEDHIGALPFILPQLPKIPVYATPFTAALANEKLREYQLPADIKSVSFGGKPINLGPFSFNFLSVTHSVPDTSHIVIKTPVGTVYHGSDFKIDMTPYDNKRMDFKGIVDAAKDGILIHMTDSLGSDRPGHTPSEDGMQKTFERLITECKGKCIVTTYSSNVSRLNQVIEAAEKAKRKVSFVGRSLVKVTDVAKRLGYLHVEDGTIIDINQAKRYHPSKLVLIVAGSQGQENSAMTRIAEGQHRDISLSSDDLVVFSAEPIPGNEEAVNSLIDSIAKTGARAITSSQSTLLHVSGHGSQQDHLMMMSLLKSKYIIPISGNYKHLVMYKDLAKKMDYIDKNVLILENGQEVIFTQSSYRLGRKIATKNVYVDQLSGEEVEGFVLRDREKLAKDGIIILMVEINTTDGQLMNRPDIIARGLLPKDIETLQKSLTIEMKKLLAKRKARVTNWVHMRRQIEEMASKHIFYKLRRRPLVLPIVIEV
ncbi:MAG: ribonuclease J [Candidatus Levybacteria bacterium]|nr:ribonuclease J [Candidatus Levybacteria bacterium]